MKNFRTTGFLLAAIASVGLLAPMPVAFAKTKKAEPTAAAKSAPVTSVDINSASQKQLEALPGIGASTAKKIVAGRPYGSVADLSKAGVSASTITAITPMVKVGPAKAAKAPPAAAPAAASGRTVDVNNANEKELESLPGVGPATAKKIVAGRPYGSVADLSRAGVSQKTLQEISPMVTVGAAAPAPRAQAPAPVAAPSAPAAAPAHAPAQAHATTVAPAAAAASQPAPPAGSGKVWVNLESKVYHYEGDRWYGTTKNGKYMSEDEAIKAGYRAAKNEGTKKPTP